jgi:hypothetical protein
MENVSDKKEEPRYRPLCKKGLASFPDELKDTLGPDHPGLAFKDETVPKKKLLYEHHDEHDSRYIDLWISKDGSLIMRGRVIGSSNKRNCWRSDHEFCTTVKPENKGAFLFALKAEILGESYLDDHLIDLIEKTWEGDSGAIIEFRNILDKHQIPYDAQSR